VWMHELPKPETPKQKASRVGLDEVAKGDVDLPRFAMFHSLSW
jgi:hypothetical protein